MIARFFPAALSVLVLLHAPVLKAEQCPNAADAWNEADALLREGFNHFHQKEFENALLKYRLSAACVDSAEAQSSIGLTLRALGLNAQAIETFRAYLERPEISAADRALAAQALREAEAEVARVWVRTTEPGATVYVDKARVGATPLAAPVRLDPGEHSIFVERAGNESTPQSLRVEKQKEYDVVFAVAAAPVKLFPEPTREAPPPKTIPRDDGSEKPIPVHPNYGMKYGALAAGVVSAASLGVGIYYGVSASSLWSDARTRCPNNVCEIPSDVALGTDAGRAADIATGAFLTAGVSAATGLILLLLSQ